MTIASGSIVYRHGATPCSGVGLTWTSGELDSALEGPVTALLFDDAGKAKINEIMGTLVETQFAEDGLKRVLSDPDDIENWRVGEAIAETYLTDHRACQFPWPDGRDERKRGSSLPGADLVGFGKDENGICLAFGEVKTSSEDKYPPNTMHGLTGLKKQLEDLRDQETNRNDLVKYLAHRVKIADWRPQFEAAGKRYLANTSDCQLFGFLVRDVPPDQRDLSSRVQALAKNCPNGTRIELLALYLPESSLNEMGKAVLSKRTGGNA